MESLVKANSRKTSVKIAQMAIIEKKKERQSALRHEEYILVAAWRFCAAINVFVPHSEYIIILVIDPLRCKFNRSIAEHNILAPAAMTAAVGSEQFFAQGNRVEFAF